MDLVRLAYYSRNRLDTTQGALAERVSDLLVKSVANNRKVDISGGLIFSKEWFAQVLEGDRVAVTGTYARIERDPRHAEVTRCEVTQAALQLLVDGGRWLERGDRGAVPPIFGQRTVRSAWHERRRPVRPHRGGARLSDASSRHEHSRALAVGVARSGCGAQRASPDAGFLRRLEAIPGLPGRAVPV